VEASEALAEAHVLGIVHRDLKPANLFLARRPSGARVVKLLDFGISKNPLKDETDHGLTSTQMMMGTPHYMSPEQIRSTRNVDSRTDIWALGVILYELIAGTLPFQGETATGIIAAIISEEARPLKQLVPEVPDALAAAVHRCLQRDREQRFKNVGELAAELARFGGEGSRQKLPHILNIVSGSQGTLRPATDLGTVSATTGSSIKENSTRINWNQTTGAGTRVSSPRGAYIALAVAGVVLTGAVAVVTATVLRGPGPSAALQPEPPLPERPSTLETPKNPGADGSAATMAAVVSVAPLPGPTAASADAAPLPASSPPPPRRVEPRRTEPEPRRPPPAPGPVAAATPDPTSTEQVAPPPTDRTPDTPPTGRGSLDMGLK
jgi:serine/threonine-protein kinase